MSKPRGFWEVGKQLQQTAATVEEAQERLDDSCSKCKFAATCNEWKCPIYKEHQLRLLTVNVGKPEKRQFEYKTRKYTKPTPETRMRTALLSYLDSRVKTCTHHEAICLLDDASSQIETGSYSYALYLLVSGGMPRTAAKCQAIMRKYQ